MHLQNVYLRSMETFLQYHSNVSWQSLETWTAQFDPQSSKIEHFEDRGSSRVPSCSRPFENLLSRVSRLLSRVSRLLSGKNKGLFAWLTFDMSESYGQHILAFFSGRSILNSGPWFLTECVYQKIRVGAFLSLTSFAEIFLGWVLQKNG